MDKNDPDFNQDESVVLEEGQADIFDQEIRRLHSRGCSSTQLHYFILNTVCYFHPERRYNKCLPSMMAQRRELVALTDEFPTQNIIMDTDEDDSLITQIRCL